MTRFTEWKITAKAVVLAAGVSALVAGGLAARPTQLVERTSATADVPDPACAVPVPYHCDPYPDSASTTTTTSPVPAEEVPTTLAPAQVVERVIVVERRLEKLEATTTTTLPRPLPAPKPTGLAARTEDGQLVITWDPTPDAAAYTLMVNGQGQSAVCCEARLTAPDGPALIKLAAVIKDRPSPGADDWATLDVPPVSSESVAPPA